MVSEIEMTEFSEKSWEIIYQEYDREAESTSEAHCEFELSTDEDAVIYHLNVPQEIANRGIGTSILELAERTIKDKTTAKRIYAQIGADDGATRHLLSEKFGYDIIGTDYRDALGTIVDAQKEIR